ncbi:MAG TPA: S-layer homology domain-containing protein [Bacillota bacterium]|nr:S-layer homology domain-containing protein [Bacillota bacterium]
MSRKLLSIILVLSMVFTILPIAAMAEEADTDSQTVADAVYGSGEEVEIMRDITTVYAIWEDIVTYDIWVAGVRVTSDNKNGITGYGIEGTVTYDPENNILTLTDVTITYGDGDAIYTDQEDLIVVLNGENRVTSTSPGDYNAFCTISGGDITFKGTGSLEALGTYGGIYVFDDIIIESGTITSTGQKVGISSNDGKIIISGGDVTGIATTAGTRTCEGYGIAKDHDRPLDLTVSGNATVTAIGVNGAIRYNTYTEGTVTNTTHNVMAGDSQSDAEVVASPDAATWEKPYVKLFLGNTISGTITDIAGNPIEGATVQVRDGGADFGDPVATASDGTYTTQPVPNGNYTINVSKSGYFDAVIDNISVSGSSVTSIDQSLTHTATYTITATSGTGGSISPGGSVTVSHGASQTFTITPDTNYSIDDVKVDNISQGRITSYTFSNVTDNSTIYATFSYIGGSGRGSSDDDRDSDRSRDSKDNGSPADNNIIITITPPSPDNPDSPTQGEIKVNVKTDENGNAFVNITGQYMTEVFNKAMKDAQKKGNEQNGITVILHVVTGGKTVSNVKINLPKAVQDFIIAKRIVNTIVVVDDPNIRISMDLPTVEEIKRQANSDVNVTASRRNKSELTGDAKKAIGSRPVFDLKVNYGSGRQVQNFGDGSVWVTIPYTPGENEKAENICAVYIDENGNVHWLTDSVYDSAEKVLRFRTNHFSVYGVGYREEAPSFADIAGHWAKEDIEFVASRRLFKGTSEATFSPDMNMTRGMFVTVLGRLADADVSSYRQSSFNDVKNDAFYMGYIEWARKSGIVNGTGNGTFAPDQPVTREQLAVIMQNYAKVAGFELPKVHEEITFADSEKISTYANDAVKAMQMAGILSGKDGNLFDPQGTATRAEISSVLRRFVELISSVTLF